MKNYISEKDILDIYKISQVILDTILKRYKIDHYKGKKGLMINFKDFHKAYTSVYNPSLFSDLDKKETPRKPEEVEKLLKFGDINGLFKMAFSSSYKNPVEKTGFKNGNLF